MEASENTVPLRRQHVMNVSGAIIGEPLIDFVAIENAIENEARDLRVSDSEPESAIGRCARYLVEQTVGVCHPNALLVFLVDHKDVFLLTVSRHRPSGPQDELRLRVDAVILEPIAATRKRRIVAQAAVACCPSETRGGVEYSATVPLTDEGGEPCTSYDGLILLDKVLSKLAAPRPGQRDVDAAWAG